MNQARPRHLWLDHSIVGVEALTGFYFDKTKPYTFCRICGDIFQGSPLDTEEWRHRHNRTHPDREHIALAKSQRFLAPEAAYRLAPYGICPISDLALDDVDICAAVREAPRVPLVAIVTK